MDIGRLRGPVPGYVRLAQSDLRVVAIRSYEVRLQLYRGPTFAWLGTHSEPALRCAIHQYNQNVMSLCSVITPAISSSKQNTVLA